MLDIKFIRDNLELVRQGARKKFIEVELDRLVELDDKRLALLSEIEKMRAEQNRVSQQIGRSEGDKTKLVSEMQIFKKNLAGREAELKKIMADWRNLMIQVPNIPDVSVPVGKDEKSNKEVRRVGELPKFSQPPKNHIELMNDLGMLDLERGVKVSGFRGYILKNEAVGLSLALWQLALTFLPAKGYRPMMVPAKVRRETLVGTGYIPQGEEDLYRTQDNEYLSGTAEVAVMGHLMDEILPGDLLPLKFAAFSPCFRREAGAHGKDTKGILRVHEFFKVEQVVFCRADHQESVKFHEELTANAEELLQSLKLPYRVVINSSGDLGLGQVKKYDIECWIPSEETYRETHSSSYFHDFQTRRLNIRYRGEDGKLRFAHSLNNTALATPRLLIAIVENYQQPDGSIAVPEVLRQYLGKEKITGQS